MEAVPHPHLAERMAAAMVSAMEMNQEDKPAKKKRGRPRKYPPTGLPSSIRGSSNSGPIQANNGEKKLVHNSEKKLVRPPGSSTKPQNYSQGIQGKRVASDLGHGFTPHVITVAAREDVATKIMTFCQKGPQAVCVLSANGAISNVTLEQPAASGGTVTYEGRFEILSLSGSFLLTEIGSTRRRTGGLSVSLASPDGHVVGGGVAGFLIAASPVQVVLGSFMTESSKTGDGYNSELAGQIPRQPWEPAVTSSTVFPVAENGMKGFRSTSLSNQPVNQGNGAVKKSLSHYPGQGFLQSVVWSGNKSLP